MAEGKRVAVIGLGVGTLAAYAQPAQSWTFYEIDPAVERIARDTTYFNYLEGCGDRCRVVIGDARLSLARAPESQYDLLVLDAFSSDSIPVHLLTSEALTLYLTRLRPGGAILFHISNHHLELAPIVGRLAAQHELVAYVELRSEGVRLATEPARLHLGRDGAQPRGSRNGYHRSAVAAAHVIGSTPLWTDDFSNILSVLHFR